MEIENQTIEIEKQMAAFAERISFLKEWKESLQASPNLDFETKDKIYKLDLEIQSKDGLIEMRKQDIKQIQRQKEMEVNEINANYDIYLNQLIQAKIPNNEAKIIIDGIIDRSKKPMSHEEKAKDYKIMKSILSSKK